MNSIVIGFTGGTGSGKTTLAQRLNEVFKNNSVIIKQDSYYKDFPDKTFEERVQIITTTPIRSIWHGLPTT